MVLKTHGLRKWTSLRVNSALKFLLAVFVLLGLTAPAYAHHPSGGEISATFVEGFLSGLGHPVVGFDHLIFVISAGLLASTVARGYWIPIAFVSTALVGTGFHLMLVDIPMVEVLISASVLIAGILLAKSEKPSTGIIAVLAGVAGLFHGYAYGEAIIGATAVPLTAYLIGFTVMQAAIALCAYRIATVVKHSSVSVNRSDFLRLTGFVVTGAGIAFMASSF